MASILGVGFRVIKAPEQVFLSYKIIHHFVVDFILFSYMRVFSWAFFHQSEQMISKKHEAKSLEAVHLIIFCVKI